MTPRDTNRPMAGCLPTLLLVAVFLFVLALASVPYLAGCGTATFKGPEVAAQVKSQVLSPKGITDATVICPAEVDIEPDYLGDAEDSFECSVTSGDWKGTVTVTARVSSAGHHYLSDFKADVDSIQLDLIEENAQKDAQGRLSRVDCPSPGKPKKGAIFFCTGKISGGGFGVVVIDQTSEDSGVEVRLLRRKLRTRRAAQDAALLARSRYSGGVIEGARDISRARSERELPRERAALCDAARATFGREPPKSVRTATIRLRRAAASVGDSVKRLPTRRNRRYTRFVVKDDKGRQVDRLYWSPGDGLVSC